MFNGMAGSDAVVFLGTVRIKVQELTRSALLLALVCLMAAQAKGAPAISSLADSLALQKGAYSATANAGAEVLLRRSHIVLDEHYLPNASVYLSVAINDDEAARDYSQITIPYNEHFETLNLDFARVLTEQGRLESVLPDAIQVQSPSQDNFYQDRKELTFSLPNVRAGSIIEFQYSRRSTAAIMPEAYFARFWLHWWQGRAGGQSSRLDPVVAREVLLQGPESLVLQVAASHPKIVKYSTRKVASGREWRWSAKRLQEIPLQAYMPREDGIVPFISVSTASDWQSVADWAGALFAPHIQLDATLKSKVRAIEAKANTPDEKVRAVYALLNEQVRYVFAHVGRGGYEPHSAPEVYKNGYGDCKDQTVLAVGLLRALGIEAYPALVATRSMGLPEMPVPSVYFDHMITHIPQQKGLSTMWLDTSGDQQLYPGGGVGLEGQPALIVKSAVQSLATIANNPVESHRANVSLIFEPPKNHLSEGEFLTARFELTLNGIFEQSLRSTWMYQAEKEKAIKDSLAGLFGNAELLELNVENAENLWLPFKVSGVWRFNAPWQNTEPESIGFNVSQLLGTFAGIYQWHKPSERVQPFQLDPGFVLNAEVTFKKGDQAYHELISVGPNITTPWFTLSQQSQTQASEITVMAQLRLPAVTLDKVEYAAFYEAVMGLTQEKGFAVAYNIDSPSGSGLNLQRDSEGVDQVFEEIRRNIADGQFSLALKTARKVTKLNPKSGEAQYLLGLAQGYNELLDEASSSFDLAKKLGYTQP